MNILGVGRFLTRARHPVAKDKGVNKKINFCMAEGNTKLKCEQEI